MRCASTSYTPGGGTQYKSGYRDVPQTWVAKSGRQVHQWVPFFPKTWYFDGSIFQNFLKFAPKWRKFGTLIGQLFKIFRNLRQNGANFSENFWFLVHGWVTFPSKWVHGWVAFQKSQRHTPTQTKVEYPPGHTLAHWSSPCPWQQSPMLSGFFVLRYMIDSSQQTNTTGSHVVCKRISAWIIR